MEIRDKVNVVNVMHEMYVCEGSSLNKTIIENWAFAQRGKTMFFREVIRDLEKEYQQESFEKGDSWKTMNIIDLHKKQEEEWNEYLDTQTLGDKYRELIDHILVSLMMAERFRSRIAKAQHPIIADKQNPQIDDKPCKVCHKKLTEHSAFYDNHAYEPAD